MELPNLLKITDGMRVSRPRLKARGDAAGAPEGGNAAGIPVGGNAAGIPEGYATAPSNATALKDSNGSPPRVPAIRFSASCWSTCRRYISLRPTSPRCRRYTITTY